jgi:putative PIN family toxin of toxin-antitoxin system
MIWGGSPARIIKVAEEGKVCIITSEEIVNEISRTLAYPRLKRVYEDAGISRQQMMEAVFQVTKLVEVTTKIHVVPEDPADDKFLECAVDSKANYIVSGDEHLLKIGSYKRTRIVSVRQFLKILEKDQAH